MEESEKIATVQPSGFFDVEGRIGRIRYALINMLTIAVTLPIFLAIGDRNPVGQSILALGAFMVLVPTVIKRLHDIDKNGTWLWALLIPIVNLVVHLRLLFQAGTPQGNRFGIRSDMTKNQPQKAPTPSHPQTPESDNVYNAIAQEFETGIVDKGLWIRLFAECDGNEAKTKVRYIKERVSKLSGAHQSQLTHEMPSSDSAAKAGKTVSLALAEELSPRERERAMEEMIKRMK